MKLHSFESIAHLSFNALNSTKLNLGGCLTFISAFSDYKPENLAITWCQFWQFTQFRSFFVYVLLLHKEIFRQPLLSRLELNNKIPFNDTISVFSLDKFFILPFSLLEQENNLFLAFLLIFEHVLVPFWQIFRGHPATFLQHPHLQDC